MAETRMPSGFRPRDRTTMLEGEPSEELKGWLKRLYYGVPVPRMVSAKTRCWKTKYKTEVNIILTNLQACVRKGKSLAYSRDNTHKVSKRYNKKNINSKNIIKAIDYLEQQGYVTNFIASSKQDPRKERMPSFIQPTQKFIDEFCSEDEALLFAEQAYIAGFEQIILRDKDKNDIDYKDTPETVEARNLVIKLNTISSQCEFKRRDGSELDNFCVRIFNMGDFAYGGRFARSDIQNMPNQEDQRLFITIDGDEVVEVDYSNLHIRLLTDLHKTDYSAYKDTDLYHMPLSDDELTSDNRWLIKQAVNIMFNSTNERAAMAAIQDKMRHATGREFSFKGPKEVVNAIKATYTWLQDDFCQETPKGHTLMNIDSWIAHDVAKVFADEALPIGIVHDSFLVQRQYAKKLVNAMVEAYRKHSKRHDATVHMKMKYAEVHPLANDRIIEEVITVDT